MKKIALLFLSAAVATVSIAQTADEVINKFIEASGGKEKLAGINTLEYKQVIKMNSPMGEFEIPLDFHKEKNKLFRLQASMSFGPQTMEFFTLVNETEGYVMVPGNPMMGTEGGLKKMDAKEREAQVYQMDVAGMFGGLVDYAEKGNKVELLKDEKVNKEECFKLKLTYKTGQDIVYYINKSTGLIVKADTKGAMAASMSGMGAMMSGMGGGRSMDRFEVSTFYTSYIDVDGVKFPTKISIKSQMADTESVLTDIKVNKTIDAKWYKAE